jgi:hypothetical protein
MALIDRLDHSTDRDDHIANHSFSAAIYFWAKGEITRAQVISAFSITAGEETQLDQLSTYYGTLSVADKQEFHSRVEAAGILLEGGHITQAKYKSLLGMT